MIGPTYRISQPCNLAAYLLSYHERAEIEREIECVKRTSFVQKDGICNDFWLRCLPSSVSLNYYFNYWDTNLGRASSETIEDTGSHITTIGRCHGPPDITGQTDESGEYQDGSPTIGALYGNPSFRQAVR